MNIHRLLFFLSLFPALTNAAKDPPILDKTLDFTDGDHLPEPRSHDWNLGPIGARGWVQVFPNKAIGNTGPCRQIVITEVDPKGPAKKHQAK